jgi:hypothetical protein
VPCSLTKTIAATLLGLSLVVVTARPSEGQSTGRLQVSARVLSVGPQQVALTQARMEVRRLLEGEAFEAPRPGRRPEEGLVLLTVRLFDPTAGLYPVRTSAVASLVYIAN